MRRLDAYDPRVLRDHLDLFLEGDDEEEERQPEEDPSDGGPDWTPVREGGDIK